MNKADLRKSLFLWGNANPDTNTTELVERLNNCQKLVDCFLSGKLPVDDYLDLIEAQGVDMDNYAETTSSNLTYFGLA